MSKPIPLLDLGLVDYQRAWSLQRRLVEARAEGQIPDTLILLEHPHVFTMGRKAKEENILSKALPVYLIERGGDVTYHGPGQLVGYPILKLDADGLDMHRFLRDLEEVLILSLKDWGLRAGRSSLQTGVWLEGKKIASIGIAVQRWVSFHGFALNVNSDLSYFNLIKPCGLEGQMMTSMKEALGFQVDMAEVKRSAAHHFEQVFDSRLIATSEDALLGGLWGKVPLPPRAAEP